MEKKHPLLVKKTGKYFGESIGRLVLGLGRQYADAFLGRLPGIIPVVDDEDVIVDLVDVRSELSLNGADASIYRFVENIHAFVLD